MTARRLAVAALAVAAVAAATRIPSLACNPDFLPICGRSAYLAKFVNQTVVNRSVAAPVGVSVGLVPYVEWNDQNPTLCAQPTSHALALTVSCAPIGGGPTVTFGPVNVPMQDPKPTVPGSQPIAGGSPYALVMPAGTLTPGVQYRCTVTGSYTIDFGPNTKRSSGTIVGTGPTVFCTSPALEDVAAGVQSLEPPLLAQLAGTASAGFHVAQPGDQVEDTYVLANNHPTLPAYVQVTLDTSTVARTPQLGPGSAARTVYPVSTDTPNGDRYALRFHEDRRPGAIVPRGDPLLTTGAPTFAPVVLLPNETTTVRVVHASHGMCKDGSCDEAVAEFRARWPGGGPGGSDLVTTVCIGSVLQVSSKVPPCNALCTIFDSIQVTGNTDLRASPNLFAGTFRFATYGYGNQLEPAILDDSSRHVGAPLVPLISLQPNEFPTQSVSSIRFDQGEDQVPATSDFNAVVFALKPDRSGFFTHGQETHLKGLNLRNGGMGGSLVVPFFVRPGANSDLVVRADVRREDFIWSLYEKVLHREKLVARGTAEEVASGGKFGIFADSIREVEVVCPSPALSRFEVYQNAVTDVRIATADTTRTFPKYFNPLDGRHPEASGTVTLTGDTNIQVPPTTTLHTPTDVTIIDVQNLPVAPAPPLVQKVTATAANAIKPATLWIPLRRAPPPPAAVAPVTRSARIQLVAGAPGKDSLTWTFELPVAAGFDPAGKRLGVSFGGRTDVFQAAANGSWAQALFQGANLGTAPAKPAKRESVKLAVKLKKKNGSVPAQNAVVTYTVARADLAGFFFDEGLRDETVSGKTAQIAVRAFLEGECLEGAVDVEANAKAGKKLVAKSTSP